jgi:glycosyltransferase involved in cell wall biosynthesis
MPDAVTEAAQPAPEKTKRPLQYPSGIFQTRSFSEMMNNGSAPAGLSVGIDGSNLRHGGGVTHLVELLRAARPHQYGIEEIVVWGGEKLLSRLPQRPWLRAIHDRRLDRSLLSRLCWQHFVLPALARKHCRILFTPGGTGGSSLRPFVTMSQNLLPFDRDERQRYGFSLTHWRLKLLRYSQRAAFRNAEGVIFLTDFARETISHEIGRTSLETTIIPHGVDARFRMAPRAQKGIESYSAERPLKILYVSVVDLYKHQWQVVKAIAALRRKGLPVQLDLIGSFLVDPARRRLERSLKEADPGGIFIRHHGAVPFDILHHHYHEADIFVFASSCENLPNILLEAMAAGLPIACSRRGPMPEVLGDAGAYFDPESPDEIAAALELMIHNPDLRMEMAGDAYRRSEKYSWEECADKTLSFIARVAEGEARRNG